jgi:uncharacterized protein with NRDE domain
MCLVLVAWRGHENYRCVLAANRDELHSRPAQPAHWWHGDPPILAGRDLSAGGTWLGLTRSGRFAALTNYRDSRPRLAEAPSRGLLLTSILTSTEPAAQSLEFLYRASPDYNPFNLLFSDGEQLAIYESVPRAGRILDPGIYGLSNHLLDTPWPKVRRAKSLLSIALSQPDGTDAALGLLRDEQPAADEELPRTGLSLPWERLLSSAFVRAPDYGTRCSTVVRIDESGRACFDEWSWDAAGAQTGAVSLQFELE